MKIHDEYIPDKLFSEFLARMPEVCVELVLEHDGKVLLVKRTNEPAKGAWFWPGGRLYKGETFLQAVHRIAKEELGIEVEIKRQLGVYNHFWDESSFENVPSRHTVNIVYIVRPKEKVAKITLDAQHSAYKFISEVEHDLHGYVRQYLEDSGFGSTIS